MYRYWISYAYAGGGRGNAEITLAKPFDGSQDAEIIRSQIRNAPGNQHIGGVVILSIQPLPIVAAPAPRAAGPEPL